MGEGDTHFDEVKNFEAKNECDSSKDDSNGKYFILVMRFFLKIGRFMMLHLQKKLTLNCVVDQPRMVLYMCGIALKI